MVTGADGYGAPDCAFHGATYTTPHGAPHSASYGTQYCEPHTI